MDKEKLLIDLNHKAESIKAHINRLKRDELVIHMLDVEMLKKKTIEFYDTVFELEKFVENSSDFERGKVLEAQPPVIEIPIPEPTVVEESPIITEVVSEEVEIKEETIIENTAEVATSKVIVEDVIIEEAVIPEPVVSTPPIIENIPETEVIPEAIVEAPIVEEKVQETIVVDEIEKKDNPPVNIELAEPKQTTYDLFSGNSENAVAEKYHAKDEQSIADKMQKSHIANIREAIGINEKFLFINELFNGDLGRYNKILDDINELPTKQGVDTYLFELKIQFQWADDSEAYAKLKELLERKFV